MTDLLKSAKQETEIDMSLVKINAIALIGFLFSLSFAFSLHQLYQSTESIVLSTSLAFIFGILFLVVVFLQSILIKDFKRVATLLFLQSIALLIPFIFVLSGFILVGFLMTFLLLLWGSSSCKSELQYNMKIRIFRISKFVLPKAITGLSIFVVASYMSVFQSTGLLITQETFKRIILPAESLVKLVRPTFSFDDDFADSILKVTPNIETVPKSELKNLVLRQQEAFSKIINYNFEINDNIVNILYKAYAQNIGQVSESNRVFILLGLGLVFFLLIKSIGTPISWFVAFISAIIYEILITLGFAIVVLETRSREIILLK